MKTHIDSLLLASGKPLRTFTLRPFQVSAFSRCLDYRRQSFDRSLPDKWRHQARAAMRVCALCAFNPSVQD